MCVQFGLRKIAIAVTLLLPLCALAQPADPTSDSGPPVTGSVDQCSQAFVATQKLRKQGKLIDARKQAVICAKPQCPEDFQKHCQQWLQKLDEAIPSLAIVAQKPDGSDTTAVSVTIDGKLVSEQLDGKPLVLDPGSYQVRLAHEGCKAIEQTVVLAQGQKNRVLNVKFESLSAPPPTGTSEPVGPPPGGDESATGGVSPWTFVGFGVGGAGLLLGTITGIVTLTKMSTLKDECPDNACQPEYHEDVDSVTTLSHVSTVGFVVGGVGVAIGLVGLFALSDEPTAEKEQAWSVTPILGPGVVGISGTMP